MCFSASETCRSFGAVKPKASKDLPLPEAMSSSQGNAGNDDRERGFHCSLGYLAWPCSAQAAGGSCAAFAQPRVARWAAASATEMACNVILNCTCSAGSLNGHRGSRLPRLLLVESVRRKAAAAEEGSGQVRHKPCKNAFFFGTYSLLASGGSTTATSSGPCPCCWGRFGDVITTTTEGGDAAAELWTGIDGWDRCASVNPWEGRVPQLLSLRGSVPSPPGRTCPRSENGAPLSGMPRAAGLLRGSSGRGRRLPPAHCG